MMMKKNNRFYFAIVLATVMSMAVVSCSNDEGLSEGDLTVPKGYALSAGTSTIYSSSSFA